MRDLVLLISTIIFATTFNSSSFAIELKAGAKSGVMVQPTSSYYHFVYGGLLEASFFTRKLIVRASYIERPEFSHNGFSDQEFGTFGHIGSQLTKTKTHGLTAFLGYGQMIGYVKYEEESLPENKRSFIVKGPSALLEYHVKLAQLDFSVAHQSFTGVASDEQLDAFVAWPYGFIFFNTSYYW